MTSIWPSLDDLPPNTITPPGYTYQQLRRDQIQDLARLIHTWYPDISIGSGKHYVDPNFYENQVSLFSEPETDTIVYVGMYEEKIVCAMGMQYFSESNNLFSRFGVCAPEHRGTGATLFAGFAMDALAGAMKIAMVYAYVTLKNKSMQQMSERAGMRPVGILPFSDIELNNSGEAVYVAEALYVKTYEDLDTMQPISIDNLTPRLQDIFRAVRSGLESKKI